MKIAHYFLILTGCITLISCTPAGTPSTRFAANFINRQNVVTITKESFAPKNPMNIAIYQHTQKPLMPYKVIGVATVSKFNLVGKERQEETLHKMIKSLAASIGGDAVINLNNNKENIQASIIQFQRILI